MSQTGLSSKRTSRSVNDFVDSDGTLRDALQAMDVPRKTASHSINDPSMDTGTGTGFPDSSIAPPPLNQLGVVDPAIFDAMAAAVIDGVTTQKAAAGTAGDANSAGKGTESDALKEDFRKELRRLAVLKSYRVIGSSAGQNPSYERLISLTSRVFKIPIAYISVIDTEKQHYLASRGLGGSSPSSTPRQGSICAYAMSTDDDLLVIPDLTKHPLFSSHEMVVDVPYLRFYASVPLICPEKYRLGTLCILDTAPRPEGLSLNMKQNLREIADMVMDVMVEERERKNFDFRRPSQMIACTSNDLLTPLSGVNAGLSEIRNDEQLFNSLTTQQREVFQTAYACSSVMNRICAKSLQAMFPTNDQVDSNHRIKDDAENVNKAVEMSNQLRISELVKHLHVVMDPFPKQVPIVITVDDSIPPTVVADELKVFRSVVNYLTNACACTDTGSVHLKIFLKDADTDISEERRIVFLVEDTGPGVPVEQYPKLFKPIGGEVDGSSCKLAAIGRPNKAKASSSDESTDKAGLGLYSVATLTSSIGGQYGFRPRGFSETGVQLNDDKGQQLKGSIFWFSIPFLELPDKSQTLQSREASGAIAMKPHVSTKPPANVPDEHKLDTDMTWDAADEAAISENNNFASCNQRKRKQEDLTCSTNRMRRALIIDDSVVTRRTLSRMLNMLGFDVTEAVNGMDGLKLLQGSLFDLTLCDFLMPVMDGPDCVQQYRQFEMSRRPWFDQYIVGISAHARKVDVERGIKIGMNDFKPKPITVKDLEAIVACQEYQFVSSRLNTLTIDLATTETQQNAESKSDSKVESQKEQTRRVCLIVEGDRAVSIFADDVAREIGWSTVVVGSGEAALRLLQMRNWDAVLIDDTLPGMSSSGLVEHFRDWEKINRVNRQRNVYQMSSSFIPIQLSKSSTTVQLPSGFDGAMGKPITANVLRDFLSKSAEVTSSMSKDIVSR
mmetsp:Transcript_30035/g.72920  ORF Transcript_30035/g.72920 Transcript_30035/m.72920 type:complete len:952 (+) Transcript_30035:145-3000(+)